MSDDVRRRELAAIHIRKKEQGLDDDAYRDLLWEVAGVRSAKDLTAEGRRKVLAKFGPRPKAPARKPWGKRSADPMVRKVYALLGDRPAEYAVGILKRMFGDAAPDALEWATGDQLRKVIAALEYDRRRKAAR